MTPRRPRITVQVTEKDHGYKRIREEIRKLERKPYVKIGIQGDAATAAKTVRNRDGSVTTTRESNVVTVAAAHEYGVPSKNIPERSFIRSTMNEKMQEFRNNAKTLLGQILEAKNAMTVERALGILGEKIQLEIQATIRRGIPPPLKVRKGVPLYDTGQLIRSIRYKVVKDGGEK